MADAPVVIRGEEAFIASTCECNRILTIHSQGHWGAVYSLVFTPDGKRVVSGGGDATVRVWNVDSGECEAIFKVGVKVFMQFCWSHSPLFFTQGHRNEVRCVALTPNGQKVISAGSDRMIRVWNMASGDCEACWKVGG